MRIPRIHTRKALTIGSSIELETQASHHLSKVLRMQVQHAVTLFNGDGKEYSGEIQAINKKHVIITIGQGLEKNNESPLFTHLGIAISKGDRMDWIIQKATELGVNQITPLFSERTEIKLNPQRLEKKHQHWQHIAISASEQSGRCCVPNISIPIKLTEWISKVEADKKFVLHHRSNSQLNSQTPTDSAALLIGPEGGLSDREIFQAEQLHFSALTLGPRILRTETAPLVALSLLQATWGDI